MSNRLLLETSVYSCRSCGHTTSLWEVARHMGIEEAEESGYLVIGKTILFTNSFLEGEFTCPECSSSGPHRPVEGDVGYK